MSSEKSGPVDQSAIPPSRGPSRASVILLAVVVALMGIIVIAIYPARLGLKPASLVPYPPGCPKLGQRFVPTNITVIPDPPGSSISAAARNRILHHLNMQSCSCGCAESVAACRIANPHCAASAKLASEYVAEGRSR